jgi:hypothetical protein
MSKVIMGIQVDNRFEEIPEVQHLFTEFGCIIKTRLGLHQQVESDSMCTERGLLILELNENCDEKCSELKERLEKIKGVNVKTMEFN